MQKVAIIGATGMLGSMIYKVLEDKFPLVLVYRNENHLSQLENIYGKGRRIKKIQFSLENIYEDFKNGFANSNFSYHLNQLFEEIEDVDLVINCAGVIKPHIKNNEEIAFFLNGAFPHLLSSFYRHKLIHVTTDCVFSGVGGALCDENSPYSPTDTYGLSKSMGEPGKESLVLRTSIIGPEIHGFLSLLEWAKKMKGKIKGYKNHLWNGITTKEFANICEKIISDRDAYPKNGIYHIFSTEISKYEMLNKIKKKYRLDIDIEQVNAEVTIDRRLSSIYTLNRQLEIPAFDEMLEDL